ncbi:MAG: ADP-ribosylglycohydrolase family protein [Geobacteraceae bacterium]|nr:ADP-ribosylglycohydrolase family protein [Geobacteraceae bacterium]
MRSASGSGRIAETFAGCLLGGAAGDALGWPVEFLSLAEIRRRFGPEGIRDFAETEGGIGAITDDTQMTLFTAEGLLREYRRSRETGAPADYPVAIYRAYLRWLHTQGEVSRDPAFRDCLDGDLLKVQELHHRRAPGSTCLSALIAGKMGTVDHPVNTSKGCGGVMRVAPVGLFCRALPDAGDDRARSELAFRLGCDAAAITHGHPLGYLPAGFLASMIFFLVSGRTLEDSIGDAMLILVERPEYEKSTLAALIARAVRSGLRDKPCPETIERLGGGWVGEEALAISLYCALAAKWDFAKGVRLAVNHSGDSDSTGAIAGNILGALVGRGAVPGEWGERVEMREVVAGIGTEIMAVGRVLIEKN